MGRPRTSAIWTMPSREFKRLVARSKSTTEVLRHFGLENKGGNNRTLKQRMVEEGIDASHLARCYASMVQQNIRNKKPLSEILVEGSTYARNHLKERLLKEGLKQNICELCGQGGEWKGKPLTMVFDHINGVSDDNRLENLRMLCPNCNSQLPTHCGRNNERRERRHCADCGVEIYRLNKSGYCRRCRPKH